MTRGDRLVLVAAGLLGAAGVVVAAGAAHAAGGELLRTAALFLLIHAAALPGIAAVTRLGSPVRVRGAALALLVVGVVLFAGDLIARARLGAGLFPWAAPAGGLAMIAGWLAVALSGLAAR